MKKNIDCPECEGKGFRTIITGDRNDYCGIGSIKCFACDGTGVKGVAMTNADKIRAMSDKELAAFLAGKFTDHETMKAVQKGEMLTATYVSEMAHTWYAAWMQWLRQPAEDDC